MKVELNPAQQKAVSTLSGPLLVLAGAGTGKTRVVTYRIARLIRSGIQPSRILAVTFTNKAANEMQQRVSELLPAKSDERPQVATFHAHCLQILRRHIRQLGYPQNFAIYGRGEQESIARGVLREMRVPNEKLRPGDLLNTVGGWKSHSVSPRAAASEARTDREHVAAVAYRRYQSSLKAAGAVDFDDLLLCTERLFREHPSIKKEEAARFDHLLIDEYQDTNGSQYRIVKALASGHRNLCVVGDDDQSIYGWRGAEVAHILRFQRDWPDAVIVRLEQNYRSTAAILNAANRLIAFNSQRHDKVLRPARPGGESPRILQCRDETEESRTVIRDIQRQLRQPGIDAGDIAILFRTNEQPRAFETELRRAKLPYVLVGGTSFFDRREVRDVMSYIRLIDAPRDETSLLRIINTPPRGIGRKTVEILMRQAVAEGVPLWDIACRDQLPGGVPPVSITAIRQLVQKIRTIRRQYKTREFSSLTELIRQLIDSVGYQRELERLYDDEQERESRWDAVQEVVNALATYEQRSRSRDVSLSGFLADIALLGREFEDDKEHQLRRSAITLMTLHCAKGLEFPHVYLVGMEEGILPHRRSVQEAGAAIDEERRLCYVGITRAQERLTFSLALTRHKWGKPRETDASRFLYELTGQAHRAHQPRQRGGHVKRATAKRPKNSSSAKRRSS
jgi:DNA helicase-2/ATP-dependent DNA helicase PcrA